MNDDMVDAGEVGRLPQRSAVKVQIERTVNAEIRGQAQTATTAQVEQVSHVAQELRGRALSETLATEHQAARARHAARASQFVDYAFYLLYSLLAIRLGLALIAARSGAGFVQFINTVTYPFYVPFRGIVPSPTAEGGFTLAVPVLIALVVYMLLHVAVNGMFRLGARRKTSV
jgi:hypothetical protein